MNRRTFLLMSTAGAAVALTPAIGSAPVAELPAAHRGFLTLRPDDLISVAIEKDADGKWIAFPVVNGIDRRDCPARLHMAGDEPLYAGVTFQCPDV
jgi:hypothetical protein